MWRKQKECKPRRGVGGDWLYVSNGAEEHEYWIQSDAEYALSVINIPKSRRRPWTSRKGAAGSVPTGVVPLGTSKKVDRVGKGIWDMLRAMGPRFNEREGTG